MKLSLIEPFAVRPAQENEGAEGANPIKELIVPRVQTNVETQPDSTNQGGARQSSVIYLDFVRELRSRKRRILQEGQGLWVAKKIGIYHDNQENMSLLELIGTRLNKNY